MSSETEITDRASHPEPEPGLYARLLKSPYVCSNCFVVTNAEAVEWTSARDSIDSILHPVWLAGEGASHDRHYKNGPPSCDHCGIFSVMSNWRWTDEDGNGHPLSKREALNRAVTLSQTLTELWIAHDAEVLIRTVKQRKETPKLASKDDENFRRALEASLLEPV